MLVCVPRSEGHRCPTTSTNVVPHLLKTGPNGTEQDLTASPKGRELQGPFLHMASRGQQREGWTQGAGGCLMGGSLPACEWDGRMGGCVVHRGNPKVNEKPRVLQLPNPSQVLCEGEGTNPTPNPQSPVSPQGWVRTGS